MLLTAFKRGIVKKRVTKRVLRSLRSSYIPSTRSQNCQGWKESLEIIQPKAGDDYNLPYLSLRDFSLQHCDVLQSYNFQHSDCDPKFNQILAVYNCAQHTVTLLVEGYGKNAKPHVFQTATQSAFN